MRERRRIVGLAVGVAAVLTTVGYAASPLTGKDAFALRDDTMKRMGRAFYLGIGRVVKGTAEFGPATVTAAETVAALAATIATLFPPGSDDPDSRMKPEIFAAKEDVDRLVGTVQSAVGGLVAAVKGTDKEAIAAAYRGVNDACESCHTRFRKSE
jgi:cytochrome c556